MSDQPKKSVCIVGGGYGGIGVAKKLDKNFDVKLIERKDTFFHNIGALRAIIEIPFMKKIFIPYTNLLTNGTVIKGEVVEVSPKSVTLKSGEKIGFDYLVLAMGTSYPYPAKVGDNRLEAEKTLTATYEKLKNAKNVLVIGGGPVGVELAAEVATDYPDKKVTLVQHDNVLIPGPYSDKFRNKLMQKLSNYKNMEIILGDKVLLDKKTGNSFKTSSGKKVEADIHFVCTGTKLNNGPLKKNFSAILDDKGYIKVNKNLQVEGFNNIFAVGDIANIEKQKLAMLAGFQADVVAHNISQMDKNKSLKEYKPSSPVIFLALGRNDGTGLLPRGWIAPSFFVTKMKSQSFFTNRFWKMMNLKEPKE